MNRAGNTKYIWIATEQIHLPDLVVSLILLIWNPFGRLLCLEPRDRSCKFSIIMRDLWKYTFMLTVAVRLLQSS